LWPTLRGVEISDYVDAIERSGTALVTAAQEAGLDAPVPTCPEWVVRDLVGHQGGVHRWAAWHVTTGSEAMATDEQAVPLFATPTDDALFDWFVTGHRALIAALRGADPDLHCWSFLPAPSPLVFWARRQAHETTIHSRDAESAAAKRGTPVPRALAVDGIDELLFGFLSRRRGRLVADPPVSLAIVAVDTGDTWTIHIDPDHRRATREIQPADCTISGAADALFRTLWNRANPDEINVRGNDCVLNLWREKATITWS
jgi:uncharacterized protein (TIGR03083 family)